MRERATQSGSILSVEARFSPETAGAREGERGRGEGVGGERWTDTGVSCLWYYLGNVYWGTCMSGAVKRGMELDFMYLN